jgi:hypothetical protein
MRLLEPLAMPDRACWLVRAYDDESGVCCTGFVPHNNWPRGRDYAEMRAMTLLDAVAWAMRKYEIPPSWETAYYRVAGEWPTPIDASW